jgi:hypothetical protein
VITVLLNDFCTAAHEVITDRRAVSLILESDIDDAVQGDAVKCEAVIGRSGGCGRALRVRNTRRGQQNAEL